MPRDQDVARFATEAIPYPFGRILGLEIARRRKRRERVADAPEGLGCLAGAEFSAMPHHEGTRAASPGFDRESRNILASPFGERPARIHVRPDRIAVVNKEEFQV